MTPAPLFAGEGSDFRSEIEGATLLVHANFFDAHLLGGFDQRKTIVSLVYTAVLVDTSLTLAR